MEHGNTDGLGDCQSKQSLFTLIFPPPPPPTHTLPLLSVNSVPLFFLSPPFPSPLPSPFCAPSVPPSQSSLLALSIHLSLSALILMCPSPAVFLVPPHPPTPRSIGCCVHLGAFLQAAMKAQLKHSATHREGIFTRVSLRAHLETQNKTWLFTQSASKGPFSPKQREWHIWRVKFDL